MFRSVLVALAASGAAASDLYINGLFSNGMVLQTTRDAGAGPGALVGTATPGATYQIQTRDNLSEGGWRTIAETVATAPLETFTHETETPSAERYYRIRTDNGRE